MIAILDGDSSFHHLEFTAKPSQSWQAIDKEELEGSVVAQIILIDIKLAQDIWGPRNTENEIHDIHIDKFRFNLSENSE